MSKKLENIEKSVLQMYMHNPELAKEELADAGYNVSDLVNEGLNLVKQHQFRMDVAQKKNQLLVLFDQAKSLLKNKLALNREDALTILAKYQVKVQYRNIEKFSDEELNEILKDVDIINLIEELERKTLGGC